MELSGVLRDYLAEEFVRAADGMDEIAEASPEMAIYYFSAAYGSTQRALNMAYDPTLNLVHYVLLSAHREFSSRNAANRQNQERPVTLPGETLTVAADVLRKLADKLKEQDDDFVGLLERMAAAAYATTGNGFYLYATGRLPL